MGNGLRWTEEQFRNYESRRMATARQHNSEAVGEIRLDKDMDDERPPKTLREADLHDDILDECRRRQWIAFHGSMAHATHRTIGEPDFIILADGGRVLLVEAKSRLGKVTTDQAALHAWARKLGFEVHVVRGFEEFLAVAGE